jgi:hypothetical protein
MKTGKWLFMGLLACMLALSGCSATVSSGSSIATTGNTVTAAPGIRPTTTPTVTPGATATPTGSPGGGTVTPGTVSIELAAATLMPGESLSLTIHNGLSSAIMTSDHHTNCTVVTLQQNLNGIWTNIAPCREETVTRMIELAANSSTSVQLGVGAQASSSFWPPGTYRVAFSYALASASGGGSSTTIYSATIVVR